MNNRGPRTVLWGNFMFQCTQIRDKFWVDLGDFTSRFCLLLVKWGLKQSSVTLWISHKCNLANKILWLMLSKAFVKSQEIPPTCIFWLKFWIEVKSRNSIQTFVSDLSTLKHEISHRTILESLLFIICINDLPLRINSVSEPILFAEDITAKISSRNSEISLQCQI